MSKTAGKPEPAPETQEQKDAAIEREKRCAELEQELAALHLERRKDEAERERLRALLGGEQALAREYLDRMKAQADQLSGTLSGTGPKPSAAGGPGARAGGRAGYVAEMVGYQAMKRVSREILRKLTVVEGLSKDARILITNELNYTGGDVPLVEISAQFGMFETRCRKQVADNRELLDWVMQREGGAEAEAPALQKEASHRFAFLATAPTIAASSTALPAFPGRRGTVAEIGGHFVPAPRPGEEKAPVPYEALAASIAGALRAEKKSVYIYNFSSLDTIGSQSKLVKTYAGLLDSSSRLAKTRNQLAWFIDKKKEKLAELRALAGKPGQKQGLPAAEAADPDMLNEKIREEDSWLNLAHPAVLASDAMHEELADYLARITAPGPEGALPALAQAIFREKVQDLGITHLLYLGIPSAGSEVVTKRSLFIFKSISFFGGCVASFVLARKEGEILLSETLPALCVVDFRLFDNWIGPLLQVRFERPELRK
ncbi:MAG TPA: hypothetical protein VLY83_05485 [Methanoregula sp.]|nr:hypothetical protein [Methanoregula sp.]